MPRTFESFKSVALAEGFDEVLERVRQPDTVLEEHAHPCVAKALVVQGEVGLTVGGWIRHLVPGELFELEPGVPHGARHGAKGASYWVATSMNN